MNTKVNITNFPFYITLILLLLIIGGVYHDVLFSPNSFLFKTSGDGLKNYFLFAWVVKNGSIDGFTGVNYPFGETILYTDSMPLLSLMLHWLSSVFSFIPDYSIGILHYSMLILFPISYYYMYKILKYYDVSPWVAALGSLLIVLNCPSNSRMLLHFGLFYIILFPVILYVTLTFKDSKYRALQLFLGITFGYFIHGYTGAIWSGIIVFYFLFKIIFSENRKIQLIGLLSSFSPTLLYFVLVSWSDNHLWRTQHPLALFDFKITFNHLFGGVLFRNLDIHETLQFNFWFWISCILCILFFLKTKPKFNHHLFKDYNLILLLGIGYLIYGTSLIVKFQFVLELVPKLEQLRDLQRFGWVGFICIVLPLIIHQNKYLPQKLILPLLCIGIIEGIIYNIKITERNEFNKNPFQYFSLEDNYVDYKGKYAAILALPFHYDAPMTLQESDQLINNQYHLIYTTGVPSINAYLSRLSYEEENLKQLFILQSPKQKEVLKEYFNVNDSLLIIKGNKAIHTPGDIPLQKIGTLDSITLYKGYVRDFINNTVALNDIIDSAIVYEDFSTRSTTHGFLKKGAKEITNHGKQLIFETNQQVLDTSKIYDLSVWTYHHHMDSIYLNYFQLEQGGKTLVNKSFGASFQYFDKEWGSFNLSFKPIDTTKSIQLYVNSKRESAAYWHERFNPQPNEAKHREQPLFFDDIILKEHE